MCESQTHLTMTNSLFVDCKKIGHPILTGYPISVFISLSYHCTIIFDVYFQTYSKLIFSPLCEHGDVCSAVDIDILRKRDMPYREHRRPPNNDDLAVGMGLGAKIDLEVSRQNASREANQLITYIVDMAKAEALDCLGEREEGVRLVERYL